MLKRRHHQYVDFLCTVCCITFPIAPLHMHSAIWVTKQKPRLRAKPNTSPLLRLYHVRLTLKTSSSLTVGLSEWRHEMTICRVVWLHANYKRRADVVPCSVVVVIFCHGGHRRPTWFGKVTCCYLVRTGNRPMALHLSALLRRSIFGGSRDREVT